MKRIVQYIKSFFLKNKSFDCYEYWRPNIPDNGCKEQCKECAEQQQKLQSKISKNIINNEQ